MATASDTKTARNPLVEATDRVGDQYDVRVLEPAQPAVDDGDFYADDPTARGDVTTGREVLSPVTTGDVTWDDLAASDHDLARWAADRWLGAWRPLPAVPDGYRATRLALHRLTVYVLSPARVAANGKMALRYTYRGFGTPFFGEDEQVRVQGTTLVHQAGSKVDARALTTLQDAADQLGVEIDSSLSERFDVPEAGDLGAPLAVDHEAATFLADWYGFSYSVLEQVRAETTPADQAGRVQLWPEHFDPAFELGDEAAGRRAGFGCSPGDSFHPDPYCYVSLWTRDQVPEDEFWNASFGALLSFGDIVAADDQRGKALEFFRTAKKLLTG